MKKKIKYIAFAMAIMTLLSAFATVPALAKTVKKPDKISIYRVDSLIKGQLVVTFDYDSIGRKQPAGYQVAYTKDKNFKNDIKYFTEKAWMVGKYEKYYSVYVLNLSAGTKYYCKIRQYNQDGKNKVYSDWSDAESIVIAKSKKEDVTFDKFNGGVSGGSWICSICGLPNGTGYNNTCKYWCDEGLTGIKIPAGSRNGCNHYGNRSTKAPAKVTGLKKKNMYCNIWVNWNKIPDADSYEIQFSTNSKFKGATPVENQIAESDIDKTAYQATNDEYWYKNGIKLSKPNNLVKLKKNEKYYIRVRAVKGNLKGPWSSVITATSKSTQPHNITTKAGKKKVNIKFADFYGSNSRVLVKYSTSKKFKNPKYTWVSWGKASKTIKGLSSGKTYYFKLKAYHYTNGKKTVDSKSSYSPTYKIKVK